MRRWKRRTLSIIYVLKPPDLLYMAVARRERAVKSMNYFQMWTRDTLFWQSLRVQLRGDTSGKDAADFLQKVSIL